jgi:hypothetical protein
LPTINGSGDNTKTPRGKPQNTGGQSSPQVDDQFNQSMILPADISNPKGNFIKFNNMQSTSGQVDMRQSSTLFSNDKNNQI